VGGIDFAHAPLRDLAQHRQLNVNFEPFALPAAILVSITALLLLISRDWRLSVGSLAFQYVGLFVLVALSWPVESAVVKLVAGWMSGAVLGMALVGSPDVLKQTKLTGRSGLLFRLTTGLIVTIVVLSLAPELLVWVPQVQLVQVYGSLVLIGMGLLHLGLTDQPLRVALGLLTFLSGFEIVYAAVENSALVTGLLAVINLGLALAGAYLLTISTPEDRV